MSNKHNQLARLYDVLVRLDEYSFDVMLFIDGFWCESGLGRSLDKVYENIVYALFSTLVDALKLQDDISVDISKLDMLGEFSNFAEKIMSLDVNNPKSRIDGRIYRVGVANAADRGLDMYSNWGPAIQIKHLSLDENLAEEIVSDIASDRIVIVCKSAEKAIILSLMTQLGWRSQIQSMVTECDLIAWYDMALRGRFSKDLGGKLLAKLREEFVKEFPSINDIPKVIAERHYEKINNPDWK